MEKTYRIYRWGKVWNQWTYFSYEFARQEVRKVLRKLNRRRDNGQPTVKMYDLGFEIRPE